MTTSAEPRTPSGGPLWRGRTVALLGIVLAALNLRIAVASVSPILDLVRADIPLSPTQAGLLGTVPVVAFSVFGALTPAVARRLGLEATLVVAMLVSSVGEVARTGTTTAPGFLGWSMVALAGMGMGNVLLPPLVKRYFPDRIGLLTATYSVAMAVSTALPALVAVPAARALGWPAALALWSVVGVLAAVPWVVVLVRRRRARARPAKDRAEAGTEEGDGDGQVSGEARASRPAVTGQVWRSPLAWGMALTFALNTANAYALLAWLPQMLVEAGVSPAAGGRWLAVFALVGAPAAVLAPLLAVRVRNPWWVVAGFVACFAVGYLGLLLAPTGPLLAWVALLGLGPGTFPLLLTLINLRTRTSAGSTALSGFTQGLGYALAGVGPVVVGVLYEATGGFTAVYLVLLGSLVVLLLTATLACRPAVLEDSWHPGGGPGGRRGRGRRRRHAPEGHDPLDTLSR